LVPSADAQPERAPLPQVIEPERGEALKAPPEDSVGSHALPNHPLRNGDEAGVRMEEIQKTLGHAAMHLLERYALVAEWVRHAEAKASVFDRIVAKPQGGRPEGGIKRAASGELPIPGKTLLGRRKYIERAIKIDSMWEEAKSAARAAGLDNIQSALLAITDEQSLEAQLAKVREIAARRSAPRRQRSKTTQPGTTDSTNLQIQEATFVRELAATRDETLTAEEEAQLTNLRTSWQIDKVLKRDEFESASALTKRCFIRGELLRTSLGEEAKNIEGEADGADA
jgi:hypothetical protein